MAHFSFDLSYLITFTYTFLMWHQDPHFLFLVSQCLFKLHFTLIYNFLSLFKLFQLLILCQLKINLNKENEFLRYYCQFLPMYLLQLDQQHLFQMIPSMRLKLLHINLHQLVVKNHYFLLIY